MEQNYATGTEDLFSLPRVMAVVHDVLRQWYLIVTVALIAGMITFVWKDAGYVPQYATSTTFVISSGGAASSTFHNLSATRELASVFTELLNSSLLQDKVMEQVGVDHFDGSISADVVPNTNLMNMRVTGSDPRMVFLVSKAIQQHHDLVTEQVLGSTILEVLRDPTVPTSPINPQNLRHTMVRAAVLGGAAAAFLLAVLSFLSDKVRSRSEADQKLRCRVLGELSNEKKYKTLREKLRRKKTSILITNPTTSFSYTETVSRLASRVENHLHRQEKTILVTSLLENEGKTTVAVNLALALGRKGKKVLLVDFDLRKPSCDRVLELPRSGCGLGEVLTGAVSVEQALVYVKKGGIWLLPGGNRQRMTADQLMTGPVQPLLEQLRHQFDYILMDTPPMSQAADAEYLSSLTDAALLVARQNVALADDLNEVSGVLEKSNRHMLGCILNNVYNGSRYAPAYHYGSSYPYGRYGKYGTYGGGYGNRSTES